MLETTNQIHRNFHHVFTQQRSSFRVFCVSSSSCFTSATSPFNVAAVVSAALMAALLSEISLLREVSKSEHACRAGPWAKGFSGFFNGFLGIYSGLMGFYSDLMGFIVI